MQTDETDGSRSDAASFLSMQTEIRGEGGGRNDDAASLLPQGGALGRTQKGTNILDALPLELVTQILRIAADQDYNNVEHIKRFQVRLPSLMPLLCRKARDHYFSCVRDSIARIFVIPLNFDLRPEEWRERTLPRSLFAVAKNRPFWEEGQGRSIQIVGGAKRITCINDERLSEFYLTINGEVSVRQTNSQAWAMAACVEALGPHLRARIRTVSLSMAMPLTVSLPQHIVDVEAFSGIYSNESYGGYNAFATLAQRTRLETLFSAECLPCLHKFQVIAQGFASNADLVVFDRATDEEKTRICRDTLNLQLAMYTSCWEPIAGALRSRRLEEIKLHHRITLREAAFYRTVREAEVRLAPRLADPLLQPLQRTTLLPMKVTSPMRWGVQFLHSVTNSLSMYDCKPFFSPLQPIAERLVALLHLQQWPALSPTRTRVRRLQIDAREWMREDDDSLAIWTMLASSGVEEVELITPDTRRTLNLPLTRTARIQLKVHGEHQRAVYGRIIPLTMSSWLELTPPLVAPPSRQQRPGQ